jgi:hypothetical protein
MAGISGAKANLLQLVLALSGSDIRAWCAVWSETIRYAQGDSMPSRHSERSEESQRGEGVRRHILETIHPRLEHRRHWKRGQPLLRIGG